MEHFKNIPRTPVRSSNLHSVGYDPATQTLTAQFHEGGSYAYLGVPPQVHVDLVAAQSKGQFHREAIKGRFRTVKISG